MRKWAAMRYATETENKVVTDLAAKFPKKLPTIFDVQNGRDAADRFCYCLHRFLDELGDDGFWEFSLTVKPVDGGESEYFQAEVSRLDVHELEPITVGSK
jgi:hypothetical protein